uniref:E3 ubiquitin-protein ligase RNF220 n=1 Tax=Canis lupus familiaris TaxID=9615 RepID=A0A8I3QD03_CANLF
MKRRKQDEGQVCPLCNRPLAGSEQEMSRHVEHCLSKVEGLSLPTSSPLPPSLPLTLAAGCPQVYGLCWGLHVGSAASSSLFFTLFLCFYSSSPPLGLQWKIIGKRPRSLTSRFVYLKGALEPGAHLAHQTGGQACAFLVHSGEQVVWPGTRMILLCSSQREGSCVAEDDAVDIEHENSNRFEEYEWCGQKRIRATTLLEGGFRGSGFVMCSGKENPDSDADLDVDGDDTLEYGKPQYTEADVIPCTGEEPGEAKEREALRGAVLNGGPPSTRITPEFSKWASDEMPSTSNGESSKQEAMQKTCKNSDIEKITEDSAVTTFEALKARVRELERQLSRGDRYKCLICMDSYSMPLTSIQCWHVHCEECWLRTLGAKKLCPQCNTITAPGDLRRIYL